MTTPKPDRRAEAAAGFQWLLASPVIVSLLLVAAVFIVFGPVVTHGFVNYDDPKYVTANPHVLKGLSWSGLKWAFGPDQGDYWHPLTWLSLMLDVSLFGRGAWGLHLTNILLHAANSVLLLWFLQRSTSALWRSAVVAGLFALHPLHVEPVAWIASRKDVLSTFFGLLSLIFYVRYVKALNRKTVEPLNRAHDSTIQRFNGSTTNYSLSLLLFACGLMSKPMLVTLPCVMLLLDWWPLGRFSDSTGQRFNLRLAAFWRLVREKLPFFFLAGISAALTFWGQKRIGTVVPVGELPMGIRIQQAFLAYADYLARAFWPAKLAVQYPPPPVPTPGTAVIGAVILVLVLSAAAFYLARRRPYFFTGWFWFAGMLVPVIGLVRVGTQAVADRFTYLPLVGLCLAVVWGAAELLARRRLPRGTAALTSGLLLLACALQAADQRQHWKNSETLFRHAIAVTRNNALAHYNLGCHLEEQGQTGEAMAHYQRALEIAPGYEKPLNNIGKILSARGKLDEAADCFRRVLQSNPDHAEALNNLGVVLLAQKQPAQAMELFGRALQKNPAYADARYNLGNALAAVGKTDEAIQQYELALQLRPDFADAHNNLGIALVAKGDLERAAGHYAAALRLNPASADFHNNLGYVRMLQGKLDEAIGHFEESLRRSPHRANVRFNLGNALAMQGRYTEAISQFTECLRLSPDHTGAHRNLAMALERVGRREEAIREFKEALRLQPEDKGIEQQLRALEAQPPE